MKADAQAAVDQKGAQLSQAASERAQNVLTGLSATGNAATKKTFLPAFLSSLGIDGLENRNGTLAFTYNPTALSWGHLSFEILAKPPEVFDQLKNKIPAASRDARTKALKDGLGDFDNAEGNITLDITGGGNSFGRILGDYDQEIGTELFRMATTEVNTYAGARASQDLNQLIATLPPGETVDQTQARDLALAKRLDTLTKMAADATIGAALQLVETLDAKKFFRLADLAANQPQLYFTGTVKRRDVVVGTDSWSFKTTWEIPVGANINKLRKSCQGPITFACYTTYVEKAETDKSLAVKSRFKLEVSGGEESPYDYSIPDLNVTLHLDRIRMLFATGTYGRSIIQDESGKDLSRFDFEGKYEDVSGDKTREDRLVLTATFTQKFTDDMDFALSAVWANNPEYRGTVDKELSARAGLRYKIDRKSK